MELAFESRMLIDGALVEAQGARTYDNVNPATESVIGPVADASTADMERAVAAARRSFDDPYAAVSEELARYRAAPLADLPPFAGGAVGLFGYDLVRYAEPTVGTRDSEIGMPDLALMVSDVLLAFDHLRHEVTVLANVFADGGGDSKPSNSWRRVADTA